MRRRNIALHPDLMGSHVEKALLLMGCRITEYAAPEVSRLQATGVFGYITRDRGDENRIKGFAALGLPALCLNEGDGRFSFTEALTDPSEDLLVDSLSDQINAQDLLQRMVQLRRLNRARRELSMRRGEPLPFQKVDADFTVLFASDSASRNALPRDFSPHINLVHAFSQDGLAPMVDSTQPDAILIAGTQCSTGMGTYLRGHPDYRFLPLVGVMQTLEDIPEGLTDIFSMNVDTDILSARLLRLCAENHHRKRVHAGLFAAHEEKAEKDTGLMRHEQFLDHVANYLEINPRGVRIASIKTPFERRKSIAGPVAAAIQLATRAEETASYLGDGRFAILITEDDDEGRKQIEYRLRSILQNTLLTVDDISGDAPLEWEFGASASMPGDSASDLIDRAFACAK